MKTHRATHPVVPAAKHTPPSPPPNPWRLRGQQFLAGAPAMFTVLTSLLLVLAMALQWPLLVKLGERALCYADWAGFWEAATAPLPGGCLNWCGSFLAVLFHAPWLGMTCFLLLGALVVTLGRRWARLSWAAALIPCALVAFQVTYCGFSAWIFMEAAFPQNYLLEWAVVCFIVGALKRFGAWGLLTVALYPVVGPTVLVGLLGAACGRKPAVGTRVACGVLAVCAPVAWKMLTYADPSWTNLLTTRSWLLIEPGAAVWNTAVILAAIGVFAEDWWRPLCARGSEWVQRVALPAGATLGMGVLLFLAADPSDALYGILKCERNLRYGDGQAALTLDPEVVVRHRMLAAYAIHALWRAEQLEERLFDFPWRISHKASTIDTMSLDGPWLLYHYGIVQMARRWCYESVVKHGWNANHYALLARVALVCNEAPLAKRYARQLARIPLRGDEAATLLAYAQGKSVPANDDLQRVADLHQRLSIDPGSPIFETGEKLEEGIYNRYAVLKNGNRAMVSLYLCASLLLKETTPFLENFNVILQVWPQRPLPRVFQQALLAAAAQVPPEQQPHLTIDLFTPGVFEAFNAFKTEAPNAHPEAAAFRKRFAKSYWYYSTFVQ